MNGIGLLILIAVAGQVSAAGSLTQNRDWGWEIDTRSEDRALCYIVQLSPQKVKEMQETGWEYPSDMPAELVGRATRIVIRIGTNLLPQTPSLEEIRKMPRLSSPADVTAQLGPGRISDVEADAVYNVQGPGLPAFPSAGASTENLADRAQQAAGALQDNLKNFVRGVPDLPPSNLPNTNSPTTLDPRNSSPITPPLAGNSSPGNLGSGNLGIGGISSAPGQPGSAIDAAAPRMPGFPGATAPSRFDTTTTAASDDAQAGRNWQASTATGPYAGTGYGQQPAYNHGAYDAGEYDPRGLNQAAINQGAYNPGLNPQGTYQGTYDPRNPNALGRDMFNAIPTRQTPTGGFGNYGNTTVGTNYGPQGQYAASAQTGMPPLYANDPAALLASAASPVGGNFPGNSLPSTSPGDGGFLGTGNGTSTTDALTGTSATINNPRVNVQAPPVSTDPGLARKKSAADNVLPVFFLLSLVVNFYLGMLIRKLLTRYRALLANVRSQSTVSAYS